MMETELTEQIDKDPDLPDNQFRKDIILSKYAKIQTNEEVFIDPKDIQLGSSSENIISGTIDAIDSDELSGPISIEASKKYDMIIESGALEKLGDYQMGYLFQKLDDEEDIETKMTQLMWDIMFTTDPEFLSDGYRVQFQRVIEHETGEENIVDVIVEHANLGSG